MTRVCLAYIRLNWSSCGSAVDSDIVFNSKYEWSTSGKNGVDVQSIALHEMGHTIGLADLYGKAPFSEIHDRLCTTIEASSALSETVT